MRSSEFIDVRIDATMQVTDVSTIRWTRIPSPEKVNGRWFDSASSRKSNNLSERLAHDNVRSQWSRLQSLQER